jgi:hypothetical protein
VYGVEEDKEMEWAPHETKKGWADPYIGGLIFTYFGLRWRLLLFNGVPNMMHIAKGAIIERIDSFEKMATILK